jgi:hypothetical protein
LNGRSLGQQAADQRRADPSRRSGDAHPHSAARSLCAARL